MKMIHQYETDKAENGFLFSYYDGMTDKQVKFIAKLAEELGDLILDWQRKCIEGMIEYYNSRAKIAPQVANNVSHETSV